MVASLPLLASYLGRYRLGVEVGVDGMTPPGMTPRIPASCLGRYRVCTWVAAATRASTGGAFTVDATAGQGASLTHTPGGGGVA